MGEALRLSARRTTSSASCDRRAGGNPQEAAAEPGRHLGEEPRASFQAYRSEPAVLPDHIQEWIDKRGIDRTICDYIAGMTDRFAIEEHNKLFNPAEKP